MFCQQCGESIQSDAKFCRKCGVPTSIPSVELAKSPSSPNTVPRKDDAIWNPNAASNWSIIFTPAFGSYLHMLNWRTLGEEGRASSAMVWFYFSLAMPIIYILLSLLIADGKAADAAARSLALLYLVIWYFSAGRAQAKYVKNKYGSDYPRRSWGKPLLIGLAAFLGFFALMVALGFIIAMIRA